MDKENLYYVLIKGTNSRVLSHREPWICEKDIAEKDVERRNKELDKLYVSMSIREYEEKFTEKEPDIITPEIIEKIRESLDKSKALTQAPASYNLYSTGKHLLGMYNNKVIVLSAEGYHSVDKIITDPKVVTHIQDFMKYTGPLKEHAEGLIEELIVKAT